MTSIVPSAPVCAEMPSALAARDFMDGVPGSLPNLIASYLGRTALVAGGMRLAGKQDNLLRDAFAGTAVIEAMVILYFSSEENRKNATIYTQRNVADFLMGRPQYLIPIVTDVILRMSELGIGMKLAGSKDKTLKHALAGSLAVEMFVLLWSIFQGKPCSGIQGPPQPITPLPVASLPY